MKQAVQRFTRWTSSERPDALLILDDNLVEHACAGLVAAGVRVPDDVVVVAQCNFPWPPPAMLPVRRLGFDVGAIREKFPQQFKAFFGVGIRPFPALEYLSAAGRR